MAKLTANGGEVIVYGDKYQIHNIEGTDEEKIQKLRVMLENPPKLAYYYPRPYTMLGAYSCLFAMYYRATPDYRVPIEVEGEIERIPKQVRKSGRIY